MRVQGRAAKSRGWQVAAAIAASAALVLAGCANNTESSGPGRVPPRRSNRPRSTTSRTRCRTRSSHPGNSSSASTCLTRPTSSRILGGKIVGFDVDMMNAVAVCLGVTPDYRESDFDKIIPSITGGSYDVGMSSFTDTKEREDCRLRRTSSAGIVVGAAPGPPIDPNNACGLRSRCRPPRSRTPRKSPPKATPA